MKNLNLLLQAAPALAQQPDFYQPIPDTRELDPERAIRVNDLLKKHKLNWEVEKEQLLLPDGAMTPFMGIVRQDTRRTFSTVKPGYTSFQNSEVFELVDLFIEATGATLEDVKVFDDGASYMITLTGRTFQLAAKKVGDVIAEKIFIVNSHDKSKGLIASFGHLVLSCTNGQTRFDKLGSFTIRHTKTSRDRFNTLMKNLRKKVLPESAKMIETYHRMADTPASEDVITRAIAIAANVDPKANWSEFPTRTQNILDSVKQSMIQEIANKGQNLFGVHGGVLHYTSKQINPDITMEIKGTTVASKMFGNLARRDDASWKMLSKMV